MAARAPASHVASLDGLRGLAALAVFFYHVQLFVKLAPEIRQGLQLSPLGPLFNGPGAVHVFFVLSGYVLTMSLLPRLAVRAVPAFWVRRVFRIHLPYVAGVLFAWAVAHVYVTPLWMRHVGGIPGTDVRLDAWQLLVAVLFPGTADGQLPVGWSLYVEMILSFLMPLLLAVALAVHWAVLLLATLPLLLVEPEWLIFVRYVFDFALGITLYLQRDRVAALVGGLPTWGSVLLVTVGLTALQVPYWLNPDEVWRAPSIPWLASGSAVLVACAVHRPRFRATLSQPVLLFFGRISYSLYLCHLPWINLMWTLIRDPRVTPADAPLLLIATFIPAVLISMAGYRYIERPAIQLSRRLIARLQPASE